MWQGVLYGFLDLTSLIVSGIHNRCSWPFQCHLKFCVFPGSHIEVSFPVDLAEFWTYSCLVDKCLHCCFLRYVDPTHNSVMLPTVILYFIFSEMCLFKGVKFLCHVGKLVISLSYLSFEKGIDNKYIPLNFFNGESSLS